MSDNLPQTGKTFLDQYELKPNGNGHAPDQWKDTILELDLPEAVKNSMLQAGVETLRQQLSELPPEERESAWGWQGIDQLEQPLPPIEYLVGGVIAEKSITLLFGPDGTLKSMLAMDMAICVTTGKEWLVGLDSQANGCPTIASTVLWYDADNGEYLLRERFRAFMKGHNTRPERLHYISFPDPLLDASDDLLIQYVIDDIRRFQARLIVFDNLSTISGDKDENSPEIGQVMGRLKRIIEETGVAIILIHHATKATGAYRGHGRIRQNVDLALKVERSSPEADVIEVYPDKQRRKPVKPFAGLFTYENNGDMLASARFFGTAVSKRGDKDKPKKGEEIKDMILELLEKRGQLSQTDIVNLCKDKAGRITVRDTLDELEQEGTLMTTTGPHNSKIYQLKLC